MTLQMDDSQIKTIKDIKAFLSGSFLLEITAFQREESYKWIKNTLVRFEYHQLKKAHRSWVRKYLKKITGYSKSQLTRLIKQHLKTGKVVTHYGQGNGYRFTTVYSNQDISLLAQTDQLHEYPNGNVTKKILERMAHTYQDKRYSNLSSISVSHIYNLRHSRLYQTINQDYQHTQKTKVKIGERRKPQPHGCPGYIRVDTCHHGDQEGEKGVYHINLVDEVTQWQIIIAVEKISQNHLIPGLRIALDLFPFTIVEFHADNGSEYINRFVVEMLTHLNMELTKNRPRKSNDNALVESKHNVIRKWLSYSFIPQKHASHINGFYLGCFNEYLNYHKPCAFAKEIKDDKGKIKKVYKLEDYQTPFEKLKTIPKLKKFLRPGVTVDQLEAIANRVNDNQMAKSVQQERSQLFDLIY